MHVLFLPSLECGEQPSLLLLGDEKGGVHIMRFLKPTKGLFKSPSKKENLPQRIFSPVCPAFVPWLHFFTEDTVSQWLFCLWPRQDLSQHCNMVSYCHIPNIHQEPINRVIYEPEAGVVMTSSDSRAASAVFTNVALKREPYSWRINQVITSLHCIVV